LKASPNAGREVAGLFSKLEGIRSVGINELTGSVVLNYETDKVDPEILLEILEDHGHFDQRTAVSNQGQWENNVSRAASAVVKGMFSWAVGRALEANGLSLLAAFI
jgi:hypothetical protein